MTRVMLEEVVFVFMDILNFMCIKILLLLINVYFIGSII